MTNFVIIAELRSGYQLLATLLNSNPEVLCLGEIYGRKRSVRIQSLFGNEVPVLEDSDSSVNYFKTVLAPLAERTNRKAFGFKLNYVDCMENDNWRELWDFIASERWHVIHLRRLNVLDRAISEKLAIEQWRWNNEQYDTQIRITFDELEFYYQRALRWQKWANDHFKNSPICHVTYEELTRQRYQTCQKVQEFLGVQPRELTSFMQKQRVGGQATFVKNYRRLYSQCVSHPIYKHWLTDIPVI